VAILQRGFRQVSTVTNLNPRPYPTADLTGYLANFATGGAGDVSYQTTGGPLGLPYFRMTWTAASTELSRGVEVPITNSITPGLTYTLSGWIRVNRSQSIVTTALPTNSSGAGIANSFGPVVNQQVNVWHWGSVTFVAPAGSVGVSARFYSNSTNGGTVWAVGDTLDVSGILLTQGQPTPYFDGNSTGASWAGTPGASRSSTPTIDGIWPLARLNDMGQLLHSQGHTGGANVLLPNPLPSNTPMTMYTAHATGTTTHRANFVNSSGTSVLATGRNSAGSGWFILAMNTSGTAIAPNTSRSTGPNVVAGVREQTLLLVHSLAGNQLNAGQAISGWPPATSIMERVNASSDVRNVEVWAGVHAADIRYARMSQIRTTYGIAV
jgi:hypothetical protein